MGMSFNTMGDDDGDGTTLATRGKSQYSGLLCNQCGRDNHPTEKFHAKRHVNGTMLYANDYINKGTDLHIDDSNDGGGHDKDYWQSGDAEISKDEVSNVHKKYDTIGNDLHKLMFNQSDENRATTSNTYSNQIPDTWMLLDSQSTIDVFSNGKLLNQIQEIKTTMNIRCNSGVKRTN